MNYNLAKWILQARKHAKISQEILGKQLSMSKANISAMEKGAVNPSYDTVVKISQICNYPMPHSAQEFGDSDSITLKQYDISGTNGNPKMDVARDLIRSIQIPKDRLLEIIGRSNATGIEFASLAGDGMTPTIDSKTIMFIDTNVKSFVADGIYFFSLEGRTYIKRLMSLPNNKMMAISDNKAYPAFEIDTKECADFMIFGYVIAYLPLNVVQL